MQPPSWLYGLQDYLDFENDYIAKLFVDQLISVYFSDNKANSVKNLCLSDAGDATERLSRFNFYFKLLEDNEIDFVETVSVMRKRLPNVKLLDIFHKYGRKEYDMTHLADAFSRGQVKSKIWMSQELEKIQNKFEMIHVHAGWYGQTRLYLENAGIEFDKMRVFDIDKTACEISDYVFNLDLIEDYKVKSAELDLPLRDDDVNPETVMPWLSRTGVEYEVKNYKKETSYKEKTIPNLIINTSAEHMDHIWYYKFKYRPLPSDPLFVIQTNNLFEHEDHVECVHSIDHMKKRFPMSRLEYAGELELPGYKRFMLIGRP